MGDKDYVPWSERVRNEGRLAGLSEGRAEGRTAEIYESVIAGDYSIARGAEKLGVTEDEFVSMMTKAGYTMPAMS